MAIISTKRAAYQDLSAIKRTKRKPCATVSQQSNLKELAKACLDATQATTDAAYQLRIQRIRYLYHLL